MNDPIRPYGNGVRAVTNATGRNLVNTQSHFLQVKFIDENWDHFPSYERIEILQESCRNLTRGMYSLAR